MKKMLCPYCDHEMTKKGSCDFCGSRVKKPVYVDTSAEFNALPSAQPNECDCNLHAADGHAHDDTYRDSEDVSFRGDYEAAYGTGEARQEATAGNGQRRRRAMLASEAVQEASRQGTKMSGGSRTRNTVITIAVVYVVIQIIFAIIAAVIP